jgi:hypothetical protein
MNEKLFPWVIVAALAGVDLTGVWIGAPKNEAVEVSRAASEWRAENEKRLERVGILEIENASLRAQNLQLLRLLDGATLAVEVPE